MPFLCIHPSCFYESTVPIMWHIPSRKDCWEGIILYSSGPTVFNLRTSTKHLKLCSSQIHNEYLFSYMCPSPKSEHFYQTLGYNLTCMFCVPAFYQRCVGITIGAHGVVGPYGATRCGSPNAPSHPLRFVQKTQASGSQVTSAAPVMILGY
jgi:hypothetical protein